MDWIGNGLILYVSGAFGPIKFKIRAGNVAHYQVLTSKRNFLYLNMSTLSHTVLPLFFTNIGRQDIVKIIIK